MVGTVDIPDDDDHLLQLWPAVHLSIPANWNTDRRFAHEWKRLDVFSRF